MAGDFARRGRPTGRGTARRAPANHVAHTHGVEDPPWLLIFSRWRCRFQGELVGGAAFDRVGFFAFASGELAERRRAFLRHN